MFTIFKSMNIQLSIPQLCHRITERHRETLDYAHRLGVGSIYRRLGYLLDLFGLGSHAELQSLRTALTATYVPLDPSLPSEGSHAAKWRLQLNIPADELLAARST
jgi:predicted transcriptional regulator of viral defense system